MAIRNIRSENDPILRKRCKKVDDIDDRIRTLLGDMLDTLHSTSNGAALAGCQVGILKRLVVVDMEGQTFQLINPEIIGSSGIQECVEGCLSIPDRLGKTLRPKEVTIQALDENGEELLLTAKDEMAKCFCHEIDHLDGILFVDKALEIYPLS